MGRMRTVWLVPAVAWVWSGCASAGARGVERRAPLPSCGHESVTREGGYDVGARRCFWDAYREGRPAEFISTSVSVEGDPVTTIYRSVAPGRVEVYVDATKDRFGSGRWEKYTGKGLRLIQGGPVSPSFAPDGSFVESAAR